MPSPDAPSLLSFTAEIVAAHLRKTQVPAAALGPLIQRVHAALAGLADSAPAPERPAAPPAPRRTVYPDYIVCLEDGRKLKTLKRHLRTTYGLTPEAYRAKWNLAADYPMVAPNYAVQRSTLAKKLGLGRREAAPAAAPEVAEPPAPVPEPTAADVFARFPKAEAAAEPPPPPQAAAPAARKRQPFANQRARTMRP